MKKIISLILCVMLVFAVGILSTSAETAKTVKVTTPDKLLTIELPNSTWYQIVTDEHTEMFSDGGCAIMVDMYKTGDELPAITVADEHHELTYTAAVSTKEYVMVVTGYAHERADFSAMVKAINTIELKTEEITDDSTEHKVEPSEYTIRDTWYTAWVGAEVLNVRSDKTGTQSSVLTQLSRGARLTVTGIVLKNGVDIGWSAVTLENGTRGYVSTQFLTTTEPRPVTPSQTGATTTLYNASGMPVVLYQYTDGSWKTAGGVKYWLTTSGNYTDEYGDILYVTNPAASWRTGVSKVLYRDDNSYFYIYEYSDGSWKDDSNRVYSQISMWTWQCDNTGDIFSMEPKPDTHDYGFLPDSESNDEGCSYVDEPLFFEEENTEVAD